MGAGDGRGKTFRGTGHRGTAMTREGSGTTLVSRTAYAPSHRSALPLTSGDDAGK